MPNQKTVKAPQPQYAVLVFPAGTPVFTPDRLAMPTRREEVFTKKEGALVASNMKDTDSVCELKKLRGFSHNKPTRYQWDGKAWIPVHHYDQWAVGDKAPRIKD